AHVDRGLVPGRSAESDPRRVPARRRRDLEPHRGARRRAVPARRGGQGIRGARDGGGRAVSESKPSRPWFDSQRVLSLRDVRWFELDWHVLAIAVLLLLVGL